MKVGIITFHKVNNYGAVLQAYALQKTVKGLGCDCDIIDYNRKNLRDIYLWQKNKIKCLLRAAPDRQGYSNLEFIRMVLTTFFFNRKAVAAKFNTFRKRYDLSRMVTSDNIKYINNEYDLFISGSDQVWNCGRVILDKNYLLDFVAESKKKGSYAASFGIKEIPDKYLREYKRLLADFRYLSVRETAGADLLSKLVHREAKVVLDPTLLLRKEEWSELMGVKSNTDNVIIVYMLEYSESLLQFARELSEKVNCPIRLLNKPLHRNIKENYRVDVGPVEWLTEIRNGKYIVTNSFHGVAFSINFNRNFYVEIAEERIRGAMSSRIEHILHTFGLEDRLIQKKKYGNSKKKYVKFNYSSAEIDFNKVNRKLDKLRYESMDYLSNMLSVKDNKMITNSLDYKKKIG
ncbi:polysaccharide pyruvyl transferase family protein [Anaerocolumna sp. MB42-C2]|uniref:polysaccharide pyruvyl transferase family protein n=1 Tax=Anaerocolumna sp. MB42-C2 TaxID=3070997 RepID=UPI0027E0AE2F|nr:polysaccharide pyruvyl transferase family protein [Anaerocolumna sp. MB42-C2]WMJ89684.1 polysaccharide pyruvyl transferase family protein [Anaerocolumna sp. MB42-C2]